MLKSKFEEISRILLGLLEAGTNAEDAQVVRPILQCLGTMLAALDTPQLAHKSVLHMFRVWMQKCVRSTPKSCGLSVSV